MIIDCYCNLYFIIKDEFRFNINSFIRQAVYNMAITLSASALNTATIVFSAIGIFKVFVRKVRSSALDYLHLG